MAQEYIHQRSRWSASGLAILILAGGLSGLVYWQLGEVGRRAQRVREAIRIGMPYDRVEPLVSGRYLCAYQILTNADWRTVSRDALTAALPDSPARLRLVIMGLTSTRITFSAEISPAGAVTNLTPLVTSG